MNNLLLERVAPETAPGVAIVKLTRPKVLNALNRETLLELKETFTQLAQDDSVRVVILTGEGEKAFIAGADISEMQRLSPAESLQFSQLGNEVAKLLELMPKPTIAAVNGYALGGGTEMAIACDFIIAADRAVFGQPEVGLGVIPGFGGTLRLAKFVGYPKAKELIYTGKKITANEALSLGLANAIVPQAELMARVIEIAKTISLQSHSAIVAAKKLLTEFSETAGLQSKITAEAQAFSSLFTTPDQKEGMSAFIEKRKPKFKGL